MNIRRTWRERLFSWPWRPWQKYRKPVIKGEHVRAANERMRQAAITDAELERRTGEPHIDGWPLYSGLPPAVTTANQAREVYHRAKRFDLAELTEGLQGVPEVSGRAEPENQRIRQDSDWSCRADD